MKASPRQAALVVRLRRAHLDAAQAALAAARVASAQAEAETVAREGDERASQAVAAMAHHALTVDPGEAEKRLALLDHSRFAQALAAERALEAQRQLAQARFDEDEVRGVMIRARSRHDVLDDRVRDIARSAALLAEEREALESEPVRKPR